MGRETLLAVSSASLGIALGLLGDYSFTLQTSGFGLNPPSIYPTLYLVVTWASLALAYPVTVLVFYAIGSRQPSALRVGRSLFVIYGSFLLGEILSQTIFEFFLTAGFAPPFGFPFVIVFDLTGSLGFLFVAFGGFALSNLHHGEEFPSGSGWRKLVPITALAFGFVFSVVGDTFSLQAYSAFDPMQFVFFGAFIASNLPVTFVVFYLLGRRVPVDGHSIRYFGLLFLGSYFGSILGAVVSVALFGQGSWTLPQGQESSSIVNGVVYFSTPQSLQLLLESLNPIGSLPFLPFFAMSISRVGRAVPGAPAGNTTEPFTPLPT